MPTRLFVGAVATTLVAPMIFLAAAHSAGGARMMAPIPMVIHPFRCDETNGNVCVVRDAPGGNVLQHMRAAKVLADSNRTLRIDGMCASACTLVADYMLKQGRACATPKAFLLFHMARFDLVMNGTASVQPLQVTYNGAIAKWVADKGGLPWNGWLKMEGADVGRVFPACRDNTETKTVSPT